MNNNTKQQLMKLVHLASSIFHKLSLNRLTRDNPRVLLYHRVCHAPKETTTQYYNVPPANFKEQMEFLVDNGFRVVTASDLVRELQLSRKLPPKTIAVTFDDGFKNNYTHAFPILSKLNLRATFYVATKYIGSSDAFPFVRDDDAILAAGQTDSRIWQPMSWGEVREMYAGGMEIGSHSHTHPNFGSLTKQEIDAEIETSVSLLREHSIEPTTFAASYSVTGEPVNIVTRKLSDLDLAGSFCGAVGSVSSTNTYNMPRIPVYESDDIGIFKHKVEGAYDWMALLHFVWRALFHPKSSTAHG